MKLFKTTPNLIFFDRHDDACKPNVNGKSLFEEWEVEKIEDVDSRAFWSFVEFDLNCGDDDWLLAGMEIGLINNAVVIGQKENTNIEDLDNNCFKSSDEVVHKLFCIPHLDWSIGDRGCLSDSFKPYYEDVRNIFEYNQNGCNNSFSKEINNPFVLDFDLDCFTTECEDKPFAWPETIFKEKYYDNAKVRNFMHQLIERSSIITICREPTCCGGLGESNKILEYLDKYFFEGNLHTIPIK